MQEIYRTVITFFQERGWQVESQADNLSLSMNFQGEHGQWRCYAALHESPQVFVFYSICPVALPTEQRQLVSEFLTRANYDLIIGNFEMDLEDGEIRYKTSLNFEGGQLDPAFLNHLVNTNVVMMDQYLPGILAVTYGKATPADAIAQVEQ